MRAMPANSRCCLCGAPRRPTQQAVESFGNGTELVPIHDLKPIGEGAWETKPSLLVNVGMWRNGGTAPGETHICDDCIRLGLEAAKRFVDGALSALAA